MESHIIHCPLSLFADDCRISPVILRRDQLAVDLTCSNTRSADFKPQLFASSLCEDRSSSSSEAVVRKEEVVIPSRFASTTRGQTNSNCCDRPFSSSELILFPGGENNNCPSLGDRSSEAMFAGLNFLNRQTSVTGSAYV